MFLSGKWFYGLYAAKTADPKVRLQELIAQKDAQIRQLQADNQRQAQEIKLLKEKVDLLIRRIFGTKREKLDVAQLELLLKEAESGEKPTPLLKRRRLVPWSNLGGFCISPQKGSIQIMGIVARTIYSSCGRRYSMTNSGKPSFVEMPPIISGMAREFA